MPRERAIVRYLGVERASEVCRLQQVTTLHRLLEDGGTDGKDETEEWLWAMLEELPSLVRYAKLAEIVGQPRRSPTISRSDDLAVRLEPLLGELCLQGPAIEFCSPRSRSWPEVPRRVGQASGSSIVAAGIFGRELGDHFSQSMYQVAILLAQFFGGNADPIAAVESETRVPSAAHRWFHDRFESTNAILVRSGTAVGIDVVKAGIQVVRPAIMSVMHHGVSQRRHLADDPHVSAFPPRPPAWSCVCRFVLPLVLFGRLEVSFLASGGCCCPPLRKKTQ